MEPTDQQDMLKKQLKALIDQLFITTVDFDDYDGQIATRVNIKGFVNEVTSD